MTAKSPPSRSIIVVGSFLSGASLDRYPSADLAQRLAANGWQVTTTSRRVNKLARLMDMLSTIWLKRNDYRIGLVDVFSGPAFLWAEWCARLLRGLGKPVILTLHGGNLPEFARQHSARVRRLFGLAQAITTPSRYLHEAMRIYRGDLVLLPNALDLSRYAFRLRARPSPSLIWVRAFCEIYNPRLALGVLTGISADFPSANLTMIGPDKRDGSLQRFQAEMKRLSLECRVQVVGAVAKAKVPKSLQQGDVFLNTTNVDNTPVSVIEAMACGLGIVSTNVGGMPYLVEHNKEGLLVPPGDSASMTAAVKRVLTEPGVAKRLSHSARAKAELFDWSVVLPQWQQVLSRES